MKRIKAYLQPLIILLVFEAVAVTLWLTKHNPFYLFNFSYIGLSISLGMFLFIRKNRHARRIVQLLVGLYMLVYLGLISRENMQIEGFWYYLFTGVFEAATIHYAVAKLFGPLLFGRGWCGQGKEKRTRTVFSGQIFSNTASSALIIRQYCLRQLRCLEKNLPLKKCEAPFGERVFELFCVQRTPLC